MQHFTNFGIIKQANKQLKNIYESKTGGTHPNNLANPTSLGKLSGMTAKSIKQYPDEVDWVKNDAQELLARGKRDRRTLRTREVDPLATPAKPWELSAGDKTDKEWSEIRTTRDRAISPTTYLGFRKDPYKGYGGMMEEAIPSQDLNKRYRSRLSGNWANG